MARLLSSIAVLNVQQAKISRSARNDGGRNDPQLSLARPFWTKHSGHLFRTEVNGMKRFEISHVELDDLRELFQIALSGLQPLTREKCIQALLNCFVHFQSPSC